jgi:hypothetical protein
MNYLDDVARKRKGTSDVSPLAGMTDRSAVAAFLKARGYHYISITCRFPLTYTPSADLLLQKPAEKEEMNAFEGLLLGITPLSALPRAEKSLFDQHRDGLLWACDELSRVARMPYRKFVFAHLLVPHPPFVFGPHGEHVFPKERDSFDLADGSHLTRRLPREAYKRGYAAQVAYTNKRLLKAVDDILAGSKKRPVLILQGDHGPRMFVDWRSLAKTDTHEVFANLNAIATPARDGATFLYPTLSPVNSFRLLFNHYFGAHFARLPDRSYYSTILDPYNLTDVTDRTDTRNRIGGASPPAKRTQGKQTAAPRSAARATPPPPGHAARLVP